MDKVLRPERLETDPNSGEASKEWLHWKRIFDNFLAVLPQTNLDKLSVLANFMSPSIFQHIEECTDNGVAVGILQALFVKPWNEIFARHILETTCQQPHEMLDEFLQSLKTLSKDGNFQSVTASKYREESIQNAFITGLRSPSIRQRLLENNTLDLKTVFDQARSLELAMRNSESYSSLPSSVNAAVPPATTEDQEEIDPGTLAAVTSGASTCFFCGNSNHPCSRCPARDAVCFKCQKKGHFAKVCCGRKIRKNKVSAAAWSPTLATVDAPNPFQSLWKLLLSKDWKSKPSLIVVALKALFIQGWWRTYSSYCSSFIWYSIHGYLSI